MEAVASVVGLLAVAAKITTTLTQFIQGSINAPTLARTVHYEIHDFSFVLSKLHPLIISADPISQAGGPLVDIDHLCITLEGCVWTMSELEREVDRLNVSGKMVIRDRLRWSWMESSLFQIIQRLQNHKSSLNLILTLLQSQSVAEAVQLKKALDHQFAATLPRPGRLHPLAVVPGVASDTTSVQSAASITQLTRNIYRLSCESTLYLSRPYRTITNSSGLSLDSAERPKPRWSLYTRQSNDSVLSMPILVSGVSLVETTIHTLPVKVDTNTLYNPTWYYPEDRDPKLVFSPYRGVPEAKVPPVPLLAAVHEGNIEYVSKWLKHPLYHDISHNDLSIALIHASKLGHDRVVKLLLGHGVDKDSKNESGETPLHEASGQGYLPIVKLLLESGADVEAKTAYLRTPLHRACEAGHVPVVSLLLENGADADVRHGFGDRPIHVAAAEGMKDVVGVLLDFGAQTETRTRMGETPLHMAAGGGHIQVLRLLLDRGAYIEARTELQQTPLIRAANRGHYEAVALLLERGAERNAKNASDETAAERAASCGFKKIAELLEEQDFAE